MSTRITDAFAACARPNRPALVTYHHGGRPRPTTTASAILKALPGAGADLIELGMPFSDPMADGPGIQAAGQRALKAGQTLTRTLAMVAEFRKTDTTTPIVLMGYYNPIYIHGVDAFIADALAAGVDGLIIVDLPPEEDDELCVPALKAGLNFIRLTTPTTDDRRLPAVLEEHLRLCLLCLDDRHHRRRDQVACRGRRGGQADQGAHRRCRSPSVSASRRPTTRRSWAAMPMVSWSARRCATLWPGSLVDGKASPGTVAAVTTLVSGLASGVRRARA